MDRPVVPRFSSTPFAVSSSEVPRRGAIRDTARCLVLPVGDAPVFPDQGHGRLLAVVQTEGIEES
jgi:hypothetical protein